MGLWYPNDSRFKLIAYADADHAGCNDDCKSISGGIQFLGDKLVSWSSKKQDCTTISSAKAEYVSLSACCAQVIWMRTQLLDYGYRYHKILIYCDSKSAIAISCNLVQHSRTKHINIRYHFIKEHVEKGTIELYFVGTEYQLTDLFTKALTKERFEFLVHKIVETLDTSFVAPTNIHTIEAFMNRVGYQGVVDKVSAFFTKNLAQPWQTIRSGLIQSHIKNKFITQEFFADKINEVIQHCNTIVLELTVTKTNEIIKKEMPHLVKLAVDKDREVSPVDISGMVSKEFAAHAQKMIEELFCQDMQNTTLNLYPKLRSLTSTTSSGDLQQQMYQTMKAKPQDQATNPRI
ncbi:hypothetical protein Tco_1502764 [Tanacetum coccineum]